MASLKRFKAYWIIGVIILIFFLLGNFSDMIVKYLWLDELGYLGVFWTIKKTQLMLFLIALAVALIYIGLNVRYITKGIKPLHVNINQRPGDEPRYISIKPGQVKFILYSIATLIGIFFAFSWLFRWKSYLRFIHAQSFGVTEPIFGRDASFYVFRLPFLESIQNSLIFLVFFITIITIIYHFASRGISLGKSQFSQNIQAEAGAYKQIYLNAGIWFLLLGWGYYLSRFHLLSKHNEIIYGVNYTDEHILIPVLWVMTIGCVLLGLYTFVQIYQNKINRLIAGAITLLVIGIVGQAFLPGLIQNFKVDPSELSLEKPYIKNNIKFTRKAYNLDDVNVKEYNAIDTITLDQIMHHWDAIKNTRIWDQKLTVESYRQLQEIRLYYQFHNIDLDRYHTSEGYRQVLIAARELTAQLPPQARTWVNQHLQYTHGYGIVMSPSTQKTPEGSPIFYIKDIPPQSDIGLQVQQPAIYYGELNSGFKLVNTKISELDYPKGDKNVYTQYKGKGGVPIDNYLKQLLFAWHFGDVNILLTQYIREGSKIQFWRSMTRRVEKIAPFLQLDDDPYVVLDKGKLYWMLDAYTVASYYPYSEPYRNNYNYIRNSVKVVMDAYDGTIQFYVSNPEDPVIQVYREAFPGVFKPLEEMPGELKEHIKYPKDLFRIQLEKFSTYHMNDPRVFYNQEDLWERPIETFGGNQIRMEPYYLLGILPNTEKLQYMLICPMTPRNRDNMISWMVVKSDFPGYGQIINYELPKEKLFLGPAQIEAKINQNTRISSQISLWDQRGSQVIRGNLMVIPIENSFLYVEPVFLFSTSVNIPQLKRVIATTGSNVVMEPTLKEAIYALYGKSPEGKTQVSTVTQGKQQPIAEEPGKVNLPPQLDQLINLWDEMTGALQDGDWEKFGKKMDEINQLLEKSPER